MTGKKYLDGSSKPLHVTHRQMDYNDTYKSFGLGRFHS